MASHYREGIPCRVNSYYVLSPGHSLLDFHVGCCGLLAHFTEEETEGWGWKSLFSVHTALGCAKDGFFFSLQLS